MKYEAYLNHTNRKERVSMTKLRTSDHKLMIEEMRKQRPKPPREERSCFMCHDKVEDEAHFLTECRLYGSYTRHWGGIIDQAPHIAQLDNTKKLNISRIGSVIVSRKCGKLRYFKALWHFETWA